MPFKLEVSADSAEQLVNFCFELLVRAAWLRWSVQLDVEKARGAELNAEQRADCLREFFDMMIEELSPNNPFREQLRRYFAEVAISIAMESDPCEPAPTKLRLVP